MGPVTFDKVLPLLQENCAACHSPPADGGLRIYPLLAGVDAQLSYDQTQAFCVPSPTSLACGQLAVELIVDESEPPVGFGEPMSTPEKALFEQWLNGGMVAPSLP